MKAKDIMSKKIITCTEDQTVEEAAAVMVKNKFSIIPIVNNSGELSGIITQSDFIGKKVSVPHALASIKELFGQKFYFSDVERVYKEAKEKKLREIMTKEVVIVPPEYNLNDIVALMINKNLKRFPVVENGEILGVITRKDVVKAFLNL